MVSDRELNFWVSYSAWAVAAMALAGALSPGWYGPVFATVMALCITAIMYLRRPQ